jgi:arylsulfatase A-like enzyme
MKRSLTTAFVFAVLLLAAISCPSWSAESTVAKHPNFVLILSDDVGYGDIGCYGATKVKTPNIDRLAAEGLRFTDAHSTSGTCTPSRYSLLTGEYAWRKRGTGILPGNAALIIEPGRATLPSILQSAGYATGCVGKWHLGLGRGNVDWNGNVAPGPLEVGFDYSFIIPATGDRVPCVFVENHRVVGFDPADPIAVSYGIKVGNEPTGRDHPELLKLKPSHGHDDTIVNGISRIGFMAGGKAARWKDEDIADVLTRQATTFIEQNKDRPFFLYFATHDIHVPRVPNARFVGTSECGIRGDAIQELDWSVGEVMSTLKRLNLADDTIVIFSSDNGPVVDDGYADGSVEHLNGHKPGGPFRGGKYSNYEGGTRMPFIVHQPASIKPAVSDAMICQVDFIASFAGLIGAPFSAASAVDSTDQINALLGRTQVGRDVLVEQATGPMTLAIREGNWKYLPHGVWQGGDTALGKPAATRPAKPELYDLATDPGETHNLASDRPEKVAELSELLQQERKRAANDVEAPKRTPQSE